METETANLILKELREFRAENDKRWEENDRRWEQNEKRWKENDRRWEQNEKRWEENDRRWEQNDKKLEEINQRLDSNTERITALEEGRAKDRRDILLTLDMMQESIDSQFKEMKSYVDVKFDKLFVSKRENEVEHEEFKKLFYVHERRIDFQSARIKFLEEWKQQIDLGGYQAV